MLRLLLDRIAKVRRKTSKNINPQSNLGGKDIVRANPWSMKSARTDFLPAAFSASGRFPSLLPTPIAPRVSSVGVCPPVRSALSARAARDARQFASLRIRPPRRKEQHQRETDKSAFKASPSQASPRPLGAGQRSSAGLGSSAAPPQTPTGLKSAIGPNSDHFGGRFRPFGTPSRPPSLNTKRSPSSRGSARLTSAPPGGRARVPRRLSRCSRLLQRSREIDAAPVAMLE